MQKLYYHFNVTVFTSVYGQNSESLWNLECQAKGSLPLDRWRERERGWGKIQGSTVGAEGWVHGKE